MKTVLTKEEKMLMESYASWLANHHKPCEKCADKFGCCECSEFNHWEDTKNKKFKKITEVESNTEAAYLLNLMVLLEDARKRFESIKKEVSDLEARLKKAMTKFDIEKDDTPKYVVNAEDVFAVFKCSSCGKIFMVTLNECEQRYTSVGISSEHYCPCCKHLCTTMAYKKRTEI